MGSVEQYDAWSAALSYERYMGRWSRRLAVPFVDRLGMPVALDWLEVGCGTGALSTVVLDLAAPASLVGIDPSPGFVEYATSVIDDRRARFVVGVAEELPMGDATADVVVSSLAYNFVPDRRRALAEILRVLKPGGSFAFTVWDYPTGGVEFIDALWKAAAALDPWAATLDEAVRFPFCHRGPLADELTAGGFSDVSVVTLVIDTPFSDFEDIWLPFTLGAGPAPGYVGGLDANHAGWSTSHRVDTSTSRGPVPVRLTC
jgi:ubiquinone/menaquinone biosynthesis C-methylase UbiE